ncbi:MAG: signal peptidase I [Clostridia bacterium]|nr:signal peptidase I [Clostridia bacterium]
MNIIYEVFSTIFIALVIALFLNFFVLQPSTVFGSSMEPTLSEGDFIIMSKLINTFDLMPNYGDIVIIDSNVQEKHTFKDDVVFALKYNKISSLITKQIPEDRYWIKRVIGKAGDLIEIKDGVVFRNGIPLVEPYVKEEMIHTDSIRVIVPKGHIYVLGDNRNHSADSRIIGSVPVENVLGKLIFKF